MRYISNTAQDCKEMLQAIGKSSVDELFADIPEAVRLQRELDLPAPQSEMEVSKNLKRLSDMNGSVDDFVSFLGAGAYNHFVPAVVKHLVSRGEFATAYTPYQPEIAQGTLQAIFEFQSLICQLTAMDVANASMYDGASALAEAILMGQRMNRHPKVLMSQAVHPDYRQVVQTYTKQVDIDVREIGINDRGSLDLDAVQAQISSDTSSIVVQYPNFLGVIEELGRLAEIAHKAGALLIVAMPEPVSLGLLTPPGKFGVDIVVGEAQSFGNSLSYGGPYVGFFAIKSDPKGKVIRKMPGRLCGETTDAEGKRGFVLTLSTREQHIKRERATSNICTNEALCALACTIHLSLLGKQGLNKLAWQNFQKAQYAKKAICALDGYEALFDGPTFNEFTIKTPVAVDVVQEALLEQQMIGGLSLGQSYPEFADALLVCVTEQHSKEDIDRLVTALKQIKQESELM